ncbi:MAG: preprotein translocase subunit SecA [Peptostreptococcaceae bacterium]|nr:preprotein translocase subunit SecA [Peptostreptococcaceae bacterium]
MDRENSQRGIGKFMKNNIEKLLQSAKDSMSKERKLAKKIIALEKDYASRTDEELKENTRRFKERIELGASLDSLLIEAFATVREAAYRVLGLRLFEVQLMGGIVLHHGNLAEMKTGEGKTLSAVAPAYLNALTGKGVYVVTVNPYLARRDKEEMGRVYEFLGLTTGIIDSSMNVEEKKAQYACDIIYGVNSEFVFDYLRDNMVLREEEIRQRRPYYAIIDEVDSILIDEARTPLIISGKGEKPSEYYRKIDAFVKKLEKDIHYSIDTVKKAASLTDEGMDEAERVFQLEGYAEKENTELIHHIRQGLQANAIMVRDQDYVVIDDEVQIVDPFTGRILKGRRYTKGLHQAIEAKEDVPIKEESAVLATITYQNYFRLFQKISGMTGTAYTQKEEFHSVYGMNTVVIPTNRPMLRMDRGDLVFLSRKAKEKAIIEEIKNRYKKDQPVLVGTIFVSQSEKISALLKTEKIPHTLLNAVQDQHEAEIIAKAGQKGAVTIATNMAGRGTDIKLGEGVEELGGLFILGTEKHDSVRIDNQLRGRSGRQGDPGESVFMISLEDDIFSRTGDYHHNIVKQAAQEFAEKEDHPEDQPVEGRVIVKAVESAQKNIEFANYQSRLATIKFDQIINKQRLNIYKERESLIRQEDKREQIRSMVEEVVSKLVGRYTEESEFPEMWEIDAMEKEFYELLYQPSYQPMRQMEGLSIEDLTAEDIRETFVDHALNLYERIESGMGESAMRMMERIILLSGIDFTWVQYLDVIEQMQQGINLQSIGGLDPLTAFNKEAFAIFEESMDELKESVVRQVFLLRVQGESVRQEEHIV